MKFLDKIILSIYLLYLQDIKVLFIFPTMIAFFSIICFYSFSP